MSAYGVLAQHYDVLTRDVDYAAFAAWYEARFVESGADVRTVLDLACGTGTLTRLLAERGYEMIGVDRSCEMLFMAQQKCAELEQGKRPLLLCQELSGLDLYGTVDAAICCMDGLNYLRAEELEALFHRLRLFIRPGGTLLFDLLSPARLRGMDGAVLTDETEDVFCVWRGELEGDSLTYGMDIFSREGGLWRRCAEEHTEYIHEPEAVLSLLEAKGFGGAQIRRDGPDSGGGRIFFTATRG